MSCIQYHNHSDTVEFTKSKSQSKISNTQGNLHITDVNVELKKNLKKKKL